MFKVGDLVTVRHHTEEEKNQYPFTWSKTMDEMEGNTYRVCEVLSRCCIVNNGKHERMFVFDSLYFQYEQF